MLRIGVEIPKQLHVKDLSDLVQHPVLALAIASYFPSENLTCPIIIKLLFCWSLPLSVKITPLVVIVLINRLIYQTEIVLQLQIPEQVEICTIVRSVDNDRGVVDHWH